MDKIIYFRLGDKSRILVSELLKSIENILGVLEDIDASISNKRSGNIRWEVAVLSKNSPPLIGISGFPASTKRPDTSNDTQRTVLGGIDILNRKAERIMYYSDSALEKLKKLSDQSKKIGPIKVYSEGNGADIKKQETTINDSVSMNIEELIGVKYRGMGSVIGNLEAITVHKRFEFRVWDENSQKPVKCYFHKEKEMFNKVKKYLQHPAIKVLVYGEVNSNQRGEPVSIAVQDIESKESSKRLPTIKEMSGLISDMYEGKTLRDYLEDIKNE